MVHFLIVSKEEQQTGAESDISVSGLEDSVQLLTALMLSDHYAVYFEVLQIEVFLHLPTGFQWPRW